MSLWLEDDNKALLFGRKGFGKGKVRNVDDAMVKKEEEERRNKLNPLRKEAPD